MAKTREFHECQCDKNEIENKILPETKDGVDTYMASSNDCGTVMMTGDQEMVCFCGAV